MTHQIAPFKKIIVRECPQTPQTKSMAPPYTACCFATCKFRHLQKILPPPTLSNLGFAPDFYVKVAILLVKIL